MTEQELLDMFIQERINMLLAGLAKTKPKISQEEHNRMIQAESFIRDLPEHSRKLIDGYINQFTDWLAEEEPYLYQQGFLDGVRAVNYLNSI